MSDSPFRSFVVRKDADGQAHGQVCERTLDDLSPGEVVIRTSYSALNYKDAMAATGHPGVAKRLPLIPGIDTVGVVAASDSPQFQIGDEVFATGFDLGVSHSGGWSEYVRLPADWVLPLPDTLSPKEVMIYGTAGLTAAQCVHAIVAHNVTPDDGEIVVSGATGGVGGFAVRLLHKLGYRVAAVSGKPQHYDWLTKIGAQTILNRQDMQRDAKRPLLSARWAGGVDTVGGEMLTTILRETGLQGCVAACGMVGGGDLNMTVYPFILRGITLAGVGSAYVPTPHRRQMWNLLETDWRLDNLEEGVNVTTLEEVDKDVAMMLAGKHFGRTVVEM